jgi:asparagine synthase (glutamine-hydrolysing)
MSSEDGRVHIVYNGEVYNFEEIRKALVGLGHQFKSSSDTEVILKAYLHWGIDCLEKFVGMFALGLWDKGWDLSHCFILTETAPCCLLRSSRP